MNKQPKGNIGQSSVFQEPVGAEYLKFLQRWDPVERWEDITVLETPVATRGKKYPIPVDTVNRLIHLNPNLKGICETIILGDELAPRLGLRYAYTRCEQHAHILAELSSLIDGDDKTPTIVDVGCFTGGLLHFLQHRYPQGNMFGFDLCPMALDVASVLSDHMGQKPKPSWLEGDFSLLNTEQLSGLIKRPSTSPVVILCNVIEFIGMQLSLSPAIDPWYVKAGLISYWVNYGASVLLCEKHANPDCLYKNLTQNRRWKNGSVRSVMLREFNAWSTLQMRPELPLGEWERTRACVIGFFPE